MDSWFIIIVSFCITIATRSILFRHRFSKKQLPGPPFLHSIFLLLTNSLINFEPILINLKAIYGPIFTLSFGLRTNIFVSDHSLAHQILVHNGAFSSDRPKSITTLTISTSPYGHSWRILRRNLASEILHPARIKSYSSFRKRVVRILIDRLQKERDSDGIEVVDHFQYAILRLLVLMCFGKKFDESKVNEYVEIQRRLLLNFASGRFSVLVVFPVLGKVLFRNRWKEMEKLRNDREEVIVPLIKSRIELVNSEARVRNEGMVAYVDTLVNLGLAEDGGRLNYMEMASMCSEFLNAGTETTATMLEWIMANLVKYPNIQRKLYDEIVGIVGPPPPPPPSPRTGVEPGSVINEEDLTKMPYLKAVVLEGLRRHPPAHFLLPHRVMKEVEVEGYMIPQGATINFMVSEMGLDPKVWDDPKEFNPERFLGNDAGDCVFDVTGSKGIKMMPFGAGRRMCPGFDLALLHLEYFVANLIWYFKWSVPDGCDVDLSEKLEFTTIMKNSLRAQISLRV